MSGGSLFLKLKFGNVSKNEGKFPETLESVAKVSENFGNVGKEEEILETFPSFQSFHNN